MGQKGGRKFMQAGIFPGSERCIFFSFCRILSKRHSACSFGPLQQDRTRDSSEPWQEVFLIEGLSPLAWHGGAFPGMDGRLLPPLHGCRAEWLCAAKASKLIVYVCYIYVGRYLWDPGGKKKISSSVLNLVLLLGWQLMGQGGFMS